MSVNGGAYEDVKTGINKARFFCNKMRKIWLSKVLTRKTKLRTFNAVGMDQRYGEQLNFHNIVVIKQFSVTGASAFYKTRRHPCGTNL